MIRRIRSADESQTHSTAKSLVQSWATAFVPTKIAAQQQTVVPNHWRTLEDMQFVEWIESEKSTIERNIQVLSQRYAYKSYYYFYITLSSERLLLV